MSRYSSHRRVPLFLHADYSMVDETLFLNLQNQSLHHHYGLLSQDQTLILHQTQQFLQRSVDETLVFDSSDSVGNVSGEGVSGKTVVKHMKIRRHQASYGDYEGVCVVCQDDLFQENGRIGMLDCRHEFHAGCIKKWLKIKNRCPVCKGIGLVS